MVVNTPKINQLRLSVPPSESVMECRAMQFVGTVFKYNKSRLTYVYAVEPDDFGTVCHRSSIAGNGRCN